MACNKKKDKCEKNDAAKADVKTDAPAKSKKAKKE